MSNPNFSSTAATRTSWVVGEYWVTFLPSRLVPCVSRLLLLETVGRELQGPAVFGDYADDVVGDAAGDLGLDVQRDLHVGTDKAG
jgi:hypothetical protein